MSMNMQDIVRAIAMSVTVCAIMALLLHVLDWQLNWGGVASLLAVSYFRYNQVERRRQELEAAYAKLQQRQ